MKHSVKMMAMAVALATADTAQAGFQSGGTITEVRTTSTGTVLIQVSGTHFSPPACATASGWTVNDTNAAGQAILSNILTAFSQQKKINIGGASTCGEIADVETITFVTVLSN